MKSSFIFSTEPKPSTIAFSSGAGDLAAAIGLHPLPEVEVVVVLAGIVEEPGVLAEGALDDLLEGLALELGSLEQVVAVVDIGQVVLVVVELERLLRHEGLQGVVGIGQVGKGEGHRRLLGSLKTDLFEEFASGAGGTRRASWGKVGRARPPFNRPVRRKTEPCGPDAVASQGWHP
jgi:hypothetical protein